MNLRTGLFLIAIGLMPLGASAQWQWVDKNGHKVFSDLAPPASISEKDILKRPGDVPATILNASDAAQAGAPAAKASAAVSESASAKPAGVDKALAERIAKAKQTQLQNDQAEKAKADRIKAENCTRARQAKAGLDSGTRLTQFNLRGEKEFLDDNARAAEGKRLQGIIDSDCQ